MSLRSFAAPVLLGLLLSALVPQLAEAATSLDSRFDKIRRRNLAVGLAGWSVDGNANVCSMGASGQKIRWTNNPLEVTGDSRHHIGSVTKSITATVLAILVENGVIASWESTLAELIPFYAPSTPYENITLRELVGHLSGFGRDIPRSELLKYGLYPSSDPRVDRRKATIDVLQREPVNVPGTEFSYSNMNFVAAGHIVEEFTGMTWEEAVATLLFEPLGIRLVSDPISMMMGAPNTGYDAWGHLLYVNIPCDPGLLESPRTVCDLPQVFGPSGLFSGPHAAMARYLAFHLACHRGEHDGLLLTQETCQRLHSPANASIYNYGYGWWCDGSANSNDLLCYHGGATVFILYNAELHFSINRAFVSLTNQGSTLFPMLQNTVADMVVRRLEEEDCAAPFNSTRGVYIDE